MTLMKKKYLWLGIMDLIVGAFCFIYFDYSAMHYCGQTDKKPSLALGLSPSWFNGNFQINRGNKEIISSANGTAPFFDEWVKGSELFQTIFEYDVSNSNSGLLFKALNWEGVEQVFLLREYSPSDKEKYVYEVTVQESMGTVPRWVNVEQLSCREGIYRSLMYLFLLLVVIINIAVILKFLLSHRKK